jgi:hypothetical protein
MRAAGFCGPCVCLGAFLLLFWRVLVSGIERVGLCAVCTVG